MNIRKIIIAIILATLGSDALSGVNTCCEENYRCNRFFFSTQLLYLRAFEGGLSDICDPIQITNSNESGLLISTLEGKTRDPDFKWDFGFRLNAGYELPDSQGDIGVYWTHYHPHISGKSQQNESTWKIDFNAVDILYRYNGDGHPCFVLIPFGGLRYAHIDQKLRTDLVSTIDGVPFISLGQSKERFSGVGPLVGLEADWSLGCGFSLYGNLSTAVLYGTFRVSSNQTEAIDTGFNINHLDKHLEACQPVVDAGFGVRWTTCFCEDGLLTLQLGLEQHRYFNQNQFCSYGDLGLDGASLAINLQY